MVRSEDAAAKWAKWMFTTLRVPSASWRAAIKKAPHGFIPVVIREIDGGTIEVRMVASARFVGIVKTSEGRVVARSFASNILVVFSTLMQRVSSIKRMTWCEEIDA